MGTPEKSSFSCFLTVRGILPPLAAYFTHNKGIRTVTVKVRQDGRGNLVSMPLVKPLGLGVVDVYFQGDFLYAVRKEFFFQALDEAGGYSFFPVFFKDAQGKYPAHPLAVHLFDNADDVADHGARV